MIRVRKTVEGGKYAESVDPADCDTCLRDLSSGDDSSRANQEWNVQDDCGVGVRVSERLPGELLDVTTTTFVSCHDQLRADGTSSEKCSIHEQVDAVGETTGIAYHGSSDFQSEMAGTDNCNFSFTNRGGVRLISPGSDVNLILTFDDIVRMENCVLTADIHLVSSDCRGSRP